MLSSRGPKCMDTPQPIKPPEETFTATDEMYARERLRLSPLHQLREHANSKDVKDATN